MPDRATELVEALAANGYTHCTGVPCSLLKGVFRLLESGAGGRYLRAVREDSAVGKWLAKNGEGVHHIAFGTADVDTDAADIKNKGVRVLYEEPRRGSMDSRITFLHPKDCHGALTELVTAAPKDSVEH